MDTWAWAWAWACGAMATDKERSHLLDAFPASRSLNSPNTSVARATYLYSAQHCRATAAQAAEVAVEAAAAAATGEASPAGQRGTVVASQPSAAPRSTARAAPATMPLRSAASLLFVCSILATVHGASANWGRVRRDQCSGYVVDQGGHSFNQQEEDHCQSEELSEAWEEEIGRSYCKVRKVLVALNTDPDNVFHPSAVEVDRCVGHCSKSNTCLATSTGKRMVQVTLTDAQNQAKCGQVEVVDHKRCSCQA